MADNHQSRALLSARQYSAPCSSVAELADKPWFSSLYAYIPSGRAFTFPIVALHVFAGMHSCSPDWREPTPLIVLVWCLQARDCEAAGPLSASMCGVRS